MKNVKDFFKNLTIRQKIVTAYISLLLFPIGVILFLANSIYTEVAVSGAQNNITENSRLIGNQIISVIENAESCSEMLNLSINNILALIRYEKSGIRQLKFYHGINNHLDIARQMFNNIDRIVFVAGNGNVISTGNRGVSDIYMDGIEDDLSDSNLTKWYPMSDIDVMTKQKTEPHLVLARKILQIDTHEPVGILLIYIKEKTISEIYNSKYSENMDIAIVESGQIISSVETKSIFNKINLNTNPNKGNIVFYNKEKNGKEKLCSEYNIGIFDWTLITESDMNELLSDNFRLMKYIIIIALICSAISVICLELLAKLIVNPLRRLERDMSRVKGGDLNVVSVYHSQDEIGVLTSVFNEMVDRIKALLNDIKTEQKQKREYEFSLIQTQIKPHFLYNALDLIYVLCSMGRSEEAGGMTKALADFYRVALSGGKEIISLREEMNGVRNYLMIQKNRYSDIFDFSIEEIEEELMETPIPKLSIEPLVENAIYHGIKPAKHFGHLRIYTNMIGEKVEIRVEDDGIGSGERELGELIGESKNCGFGLRSVHERLKLYFGNDYGLKLNSVKIGFSISIFIPKR